MEENPLQKIIGMTIDSVHMSPENDTIAFKDTDKTVVSFVCDGDCCSESWINHVSGIEALKGHKVQGVICAQMPSTSRGDTNHSNRQCEDRVISYKILTSQGVCALEFRNSSNGYYGGRLMEAKPTHEHLLFPEITQDF